MNNICERCGRREASVYVTFFHPSPLLTNLVERLHVCSRCKLVYVISTAIFLVISAAVVSCILYISFIWL